MLVAGVGSTQKLLSAGEVRDRGPKLVFTFHYVGPRNGTQIPWLGDIDFIH